MKLIGFYRINHLPRKVQHKLTAKTFLAIVKFRRNSGSTLRFDMLLSVKKRCYKQNRIKKEMRCLSLLPLTR